jgi:IS30 family transposase
MAVAKAKARLRGKQPKLSKAQEAHLVSLHRNGEHTTTEIAELFGVARATVYRAIQRAVPASPSRCKEHCEKAALRFTARREPRSKSSENDRLLKHRCVEASPSGLPTRLDRNRGQRCLSKS